MDITATPSALRLLLSHVRGVSQMMDGVTFQRFTTTYYMECTVERAFQVIAAAIRQIPPEGLGRYTTILWQDLQAHGRMIDEFNPKVDSAFRWLLATREIAALEGPLASMLTRHVDIHGLVRGRQPPPPIV